MKTIAVIFGGQSTEHDVSIITALSSVIRPLKNIKDYNIEPIYIAKNGRWYWDKKLADIELYKSASLEKKLKKIGEAHLILDGGMTIARTGGIRKKLATKKIDLVFPAMHGTHGEDGELMGLLQMLNVPFVGCDMSASAIAMDKVLAKQIIHDSGIPVSKYVSVSSVDFKTSPKATVGNILKKIKYPLFVKPSHLGSSIGISRVENDQELINGLELAAHYDNKVIIEEEVPNLIEVTLPIIGNSGGRLTPGLLERPLLDKNNFFDFETKYLNNQKKSGQKTNSPSDSTYSELPAKIDKDLYKKAESTALDAYKSLACNGIARVDMLINSKTGVVYFNEINPLPGSLYTHNWRSAGISNLELLERLITLAEEAYKRNKSTVTAFDSNYLRQF